jgi:hypothetical protein
MSDTANNSEQAFRQVAYERFIDFVDEKATLLNRYLSANSCTDDDKLAANLMWMIIGTCAAFERLVFEFEPTDDPKSLFAEWLRRRHCKSGEDTVQLEAYFNIRHALVHFGGCFEYLRIWCKHSDFDRKVKKQLGKWDIGRATDLFDLSAASHKALNSAWSGQAGLFKQWGKELFDEHRE